MDIIKNRQLIKVTPECSLNSYIRQVHSIPVLTLEEESELTERFWKHMDFAAAQRLALSHLKLVVKIAQTFKSYELSMQDMISEGNIGLMKAVQKFTPSVGCRLATYASWWIRAAIQEYILNSFSLLKFSTKAMKEKLFYKLSQTRDAIKKLSEREDNSLPNLHCISLDVQNNDTNQSLVEFIVSPHECHAQKIMARQEELIQKKLLEKGINNLNDREKDVLYRRRLKEIPDKLGDIAKEYGVSKERIRQIEQRVIEKLRSFAISYG